MSESTKKKKSPWVWIILVASIVLVALIASKCSISDFEKMLEGSEIKEGH